MTNELDVVTHSYQLARAGLITGGASSGGGALTMVLADNAVLLGLLFSFCGFVLSLLGYLWMRRIKRLQEVTEELTQQKLRLEINNLKEKR